MDISIRKAGLGDAAALTSLLKEIGWFSHFDSESFEASLVRVSQHLDLCLNNADSHSIYIAEGKDRELIGYLSVHWLPYLFMQGPEWLTSSSGYE